MSRISSALLCQTKGRGFSFHVGPVAIGQVGDDLARGHVQCGIEVGRAVSDVVVSLPDGTGSHNLSPESSEFPVVARK